MHSLGKVRIHNTERYPDMKKMFRRFRETTKRTGVDGNERKFIFLNDHFDQSSTKEKDGGRGDAPPECSGQTVSRACRVCLDHPSKHALQRAGHTH